MNVTEEMIEAGMAAASITMEHDSELGSVAWLDNLEEIFTTMLAAAPAQAKEVGERDLEAAAQKLAACMDYPWEYMPEQGRASMREHAKAIVSAALSESSKVKS